MHFARVCVEVKLDAVLPSKIVLCKCPASEAKLVVEVEVEAPGNSLWLRPAGKSPRTGAFSKFHPQTSPLSSRRSCFPRSPGIPSVGKSECLTASVVDLEVLNLKTPCDQLGEQVGHDGLAEASAFLPPPAVDDSSVSGVAEPVGCVQVAASGVSLFDELGPDSGPGEIVLEDMNSLSPGVGVANRNLSPAMALDEAPLLKVVRFAPEFLSAMAPNCAPHRRKLGPCSDVCHPSKFRSSKMGKLASEVAPVADGPILAPPPFAPPREAFGVASPDVDLSMIDILLDCGVDIVNHDLMVPPLDGLAAIDPDLTPSPIFVFLENTP
ncbi:hypothetical protein Nepgr_033761 [Nepenthes gracilis]|uniref:Uncharacterized protein n=1 Tax=Nepenthes gracilis TaxID=150966 RepID=A0AAD3Y6V5_NEPGR|nr:hypothetical protein Nepgr_033761 [Nepenthes gracilis]